MYPTASVAAMKQANITEKCHFSQRVKTEFLKGPWGKEFIKEFEDNKNFKKLWWGQTKYIVLGTASRTALKNTQNMMAKRIVDTTERFIESNKGEKRTKQKIMTDIFDSVHFGRAQTDPYKRKDYEEVVIKVRKELEGCNLLQNKISPARMAFIHMQIMNYMKVDLDEKNPDPKNPTYTFRK
eukprot:scaffold2583_cov35-Attheya_sp.AAC.1